MKTLKRWNKRGGINHSFSHSAGYEMPGVIRCEKSWILPYPCQPSPLQWACRCPPCTARRGKNSWLRGKCHLIVSLGMVYRLRWLDWRQIAQVLEEGRVLYIKPYQYHIPKIKLDWEVCKKATKGHTNMQAKLVPCNPNNLPPEVTSSIGTIAARPIARGK